LRMRLHGFDRTISHRLRLKAQYRQSRPSHGESSEEIECDTAEI